MVVMKNNTHSVFENEEYYNKRNISRLFYDIFKIVEKLIVKNHIDITFLDKIHKNISIFNDDSLIIKNEFIGSIFINGNELNIAYDDELQTFEIENFSNIEISYPIHEMLSSRELLECCNNIHKELSNCKESRKSIVKRQIIEIQKVLLENV